MANVLYAEIAFLQLMARRVLRYSKEAEARGEKYHDLSSLAPLQCGAYAKYRFESVPGGHVPVVTLRKLPAFTPGDLDAIATEILGGSAKQRAESKDDLEYVRELDAAPSTRSTP